MYCRISKVLSYLFLYLAFLFIVFYFKNYAFGSIESTTLTVASVLFWVFYGVYFVVNHLWVKKAVDIKTIALFEGLLNIALFVLAVCINFGYNYN